MITVRVSIDRIDRKYSLSVKGHAGQAEAGQDIVCSAASILAYTTAQVIKSMHTFGELEDTPTLVLEDGDATVSCIANEDSSDKVSQTFYTITMGYRLLAHNYPQYVRLKES